MGTGEVVMTISCDRKLVLSGNEAPFSPVPSGSATPLPVFPGTSHTITVQPQATSSVSTGANVPSITWSSGTPTETCTSGCGTDSCKLFGGCDSSDPVDDCGLYGCGGGCSIQSCDQSCGLSCSTDQHHIDSDSTDSGSGTDGGSANGQQANLPLDYDGPDGSSNGDWNPTPIRVEVATSMTSSISAEFAKATPILDSAVSSMIASKTIPSDLKNSASATASSIKDTMATHVSDLEAKIKAADPNNSGLGWFGSILDNFNSNIDSAIDAINDGRAEIKLSLGIYGAQTDVELINREIRIEAGEDICDSTAEGGGSSSHPSRKRAAPPSCAPFYQGDPGQASNAADIPQWTGCDTHLGFEYASTDSIKAAMTQGIKYLLSPVQGPQRPGQGPWQIATRAMYPHAYGNSDDISFTSDCENAVAGYTDLIEFPIMPDGSVLEAGKNAGRGGVPNVGVQRVVFKAKAERDPFAADWNYIFCGVMSHFTTEKVKVVIGDDESW
ncbi:hypothetical protein CBS147309_7072 [Penicillium roqueforti]|nr:hypothetical protein CBS147309_7072 [Penicillium roqueforti]